MNLQEKYQKLKAILIEMKQVAIAYSGGVDSTFLLKAAVDELGVGNVKAILATSPTYPSREYKRALDVAGQIGVKVELITTRELNDPKFSNNPVNRCYFCKSELFDKIAESVAELQIHNMVDGSNHDDLHDHRPGMKALRERKVRSPLQEAGLTKSEIRELSREKGLPTWDIDSLACLSSRFPYGESIDHKKLRMVDEAENYLFSLGFNNIRARHDKNSLRIEVAAHQIKKLLDDDLRKRIVEKMKEIGYSHISIDLEGYRQGSLNDSIKKPLSEEGLKVDFQSM
jgi:uncharacterized protein